MINYFNYFTEIEEFFVRQRGKNLLISPLDWCLIEVWKKYRIPLHIVLRGIERSFAATAAGKRLPPRTLFYCHPAVMEAFEEYSQGRVGEVEQSSPAEDELNSEAVNTYLAHLVEALPQQGEVFSRARELLLGLQAEITACNRPDWREIDQSLEQIGTMIAQSLALDKDRGSLRALKNEVRSELKIYRKHVSKDLYEKLQRNYLNRRLCEEAGLPEFSLLNVTG